MSHPRLRLWVPSLLSVLSFVLSAKLLDAQAVYSLQRLPAGTNVVDSDADHWNHLILLARALPASGDIERLPDSLLQAVSRFSYTVMATITESTNESDATGAATLASGETVESQSLRYQLAEVGVGYSVPSQGNQIVVSATQEVAKAELGIIERQVLTQNETDLEVARVIVRSSTLMIFDLVSILVHQGEHREASVRSLVWIDPRTGKSAIAMWVIVPSDNDAESNGGSTHTETIHVHAGGTRGDNRLHVDAREFVFGIPTAKAFALEHLLHGESISCTDSLRELAGRSSYSIETLTDLTDALSKAIQAAKTSDSVRQP